MWGWAAILLALYLYQTLHLSNHYAQSLKFFSRNADSSEFLSLVDGTRQANT